MNPYSFGSVNLDYKELFHNGERFRAGFPKRETDVGPRMELFFTNKNKRFVKSTHTEKLSWWDCFSVLFLKRKWQMSKDSEENTHSFEELPF